MPAVKLPKIKHIITADGAKYSAQLPDIYGTFGSQFGITKAPSPDTTQYDGVLNNSHYSDGTVIKVKARGTTGTGTNKKNRDFTFVVPFANAKKALAVIDSKQATADGKTYDLNSARIPQRRRFS
jgi:hypothetical protein